MASRYDLIKDSNRMLSMKEALLLPPGSYLLKKQINLREELIQQMVGNLYPSILSDEIQKLKSRYTSQSSCIHCGGTGQHWYGDDCPSCGGEG